MRRCGSIRAGGCLQCPGRTLAPEGRPARALADFAAAIKLNPDHPAAKGNHKALAQELERHGAQMAVAGRPSFDCATAKRAVEKAICADPELADLDREINDHAYQSWSAKPGAIHAHMKRALQRDQDDVPGQAKCRVRPAGL